MVDVDRYTRQVARLLKAEKLDDLNKLVETKSWETYPMFSRYHRIAFLDDLDLLDRSFVLFAHALRHFDRLIHATCATLSLSDRSTFFAAVSVKHWDDAAGDEPGPPTPSFFVCRNYESTMSKLKRGVHTPQGQIVSGWLTALGAAGEWEIAESGGAWSEFSSIYVMRRTSPCPGMPTFDQVCDG